MESFPDVRNTRVLGTVAAFDIGDTTSYLEPVGEKLSRFALERNVLIRPLGNVVYLLPPFCTTAAELDEAYGVIADFLGTM